VLQQIEKHSSIIRGTHVSVKQISLLQFLSYIAADAVCPMRGSVWHGRVAVACPSLGGVGVMDVVGLRGSSRGERRRSYSTRRYRSREREAEDRRLGL
jgi:predicted dienelactone hydrolase